MDIIDIVIILAVIGIGGAWALRAYDELKKRQRKEDK